MVESEATTRKVERYWYLILIPILVVLSVVEFYPILYGVYLSLTGPNGSATLANYSQMVADGDFWNSVGVSLTYSALSTVLAFFLGLGLTFLVLQASRWRGLLEAIFVAPLAMAPIAVGIVWAPSTVWDDFQTFVHYALGAPYFNELSVFFFVPAMSLSEAWEWAPLVMLVCLSIVNSTPKATYDAARLSGASAWQAFRDITVPSIVRSPVMQFVIVLRFIDAMRAFEIPMAWSTWVGYSTSVGAPTDTMSLLLYKLLNVPSFGHPVALVSAMAVAALVITLAGVTVMLRLLKRIGSPGVVSADETGQRERHTRQVARMRGWVGRSLTYLAFPVAILYSLFPPIAMAADAAGANLAALFALNNPAAIGGAPGSQGAFTFTSVYFKQALTTGGFPSHALNTLAIAALTVGAALAVGIPVSYILARIDIKGKGAISFALLALRTVSPFAVVLPLSILFSRAGLWDTYPGVAAAELVPVLAVVVWMVKGFFADIPRQVYDAALVFAKSEGQIFGRVALPLVARGIAVTAIFGFVLVWNEFLISSILTGPRTSTVAVGIWTGLTAGNTERAFIAIETAATLAYLPALAVMLAIRKYLAKGFSLATAR